MAVIKTFLKEPYIDQSNKLRKDNVLEVGKHLELESHEKGKLSKSNSWLTMTYLKKKY